MVHISQCADHRIEKVEDAVKVGDEIRVKILNVDTEAKRISLSIREALADEALEFEPDEFAIPEAEAPAEEPAAPAEEPEAPAEAPAAEPEA